MVDGAETDTYVKRCTIVKNLPSLHTRQFTSDARKIEQTYRWLTDLEYQVRTLQDLSINGFTV